MALPQIGSVSFNGKKIEQELDGIVQKKLPFLASVTINRLRYQAQLDAQASMKSTFKHLVKYTLSGVMISRKDAESTPIYQKARPDKLWANVLINFDGRNPRDEYLLPQIIGGNVYRTRFQRRLTERVREDIAYMRPIHESNANKRRGDRIPPSQYTEALYGIGGMEDIRAPKEYQTKLSKLTAKLTKYRTERTYIYVPYPAIQPNYKNNLYFQPGVGGGKVLKSGIYKAKWGKGDTPKEMTQLFAQVRSIPTVRPKWNFVSVVEQSVAANTQDIFNKVVKDWANR